MDLIPLVYGNLLSDKYNQERFAIYLQLLNPYRRQTVSLLDIGCYTADLLTFFPNGLDYYGVDTDEAALRIAQSRGAKVFKVDLETHSLPFLDKKFDVIIATEVLEHLKDPENLIRQIKNLMAKDGIVLLSLPNECTIYHRFKVFFGKGIDGTGFAAHYHLHFPTLRQNDEFIGKHFRIIKRRFWVHLGEGRLEKLLSKVNYKFWEKIAKFWPALFARGVIYLCASK